MDPIYIPSYKRSNHDITIKLVEKLKKQNIKFKFLIEGKEYDDYIKLLGDKEYIHILPEEYCGYGIAIVLKYLILELKQKDFFYIDDDIQGFLKRNEFNEEKEYWKMEKEEEWMNVFQYFNMYKNVYPLIGIAVKQIGWTNRNKFIEFMLPYACVKYNLSILDKDDYEKYCKKIDEFDAKRYHLHIDYYSNAILLSLGYKTGCINKFQFIFPLCNSQKGGCADDYAKYDEQQVACCKYIASKFSGFSTKTKPKQLKHTKLHRVKIDLKKLYAFGHAKKSNSGMFKYFK